MMTIDDRLVGGLELLVSWWHDDIGGWWLEHGQNDDDVILKWSLGNPFFFKNQFFFFIFSKKLFFKLFHLKEKDIIFNTKKWPKFFRIFFTMNLAVKKFFLYYLHPKYQVRTTKSGWKIGKSYPPPPEMGPFRGGGGRILQVPSRHLCFSMRRIFFFKSNHTKILFMGNWRFFNLFTYNFDALHYIIIPQLKLSGSLRNFFYPPSFTSQKNSQITCKSRFN